MTENEEEHSLCVNCGEAMRRLVWVAEEEAVRLRHAALREEAERARNAASQNSPGYWQKLKSFFYGPTAQEAKRATADGRTALSTTPGGRQPRNRQQVRLANGSTLVEDCIYPPG
jgi:NMD protein affecting ribosome stability and mRNA decay